MRIARVGLVFTLLTAPGAAEDAAQQGAAIAKTNCSRCHAIGVRGRSPNPKSPPFRVLSRKYPLANLEEALAEGILVGHQGQEMPNFAFSPEQIQALLAYLNSVQRK